MANVTPDNIEAFRAELVANYQAETAGLLHVIRSIPDDRLDFSPHEKSMTARDLALHCATAIRWFTNFIREGQFGDEPGIDDPFATSEDLAVRVEKELGEEIAFLESLDAPALLREAPFLDGNAYSTYEFMRWGVVHLIHHRGQLSTYLRVAGCKVPSIYGGSADEPYGSEAAEA